MGPLNMIAWAYSGLLMKCLNGPWAFTGLIQKG